MRAAILLTLLALLAPAPPATHAADADLARSLVRRVEERHGRIADLVARFYRPTGGEIRLNGVPLEKIRLHSYRRLLGIVSQDTFLFDGTIAENLAYGRPEATREEIIAAARQANAHDFIADFLPWSGVGGLIAAD